jgi:hypothetical protein
VQQQQQQAVQELGALLLSNKARTKAIAAAVKTLAVQDGGKALVYACAEQHARELAVGLMMQGIPSLALHEGQTPEEHAAVLWAFENGTDRVLVISNSCTRVLTTAGLGCPVGCVVMGVPTLHPEVYAAAAAPGLVAGLIGGAGGWGSGSSSSSSCCCLFVEFADQLGASAAATAAAADLPAAAEAAVASSSKRRRRTRTAQHAAAAAAVSPAAQLLHCQDVFGSSMCRLLPLPASLTAAIAASTAPPQPPVRSRPAVNSSNKGSSSSSSSQGSRGDVIWIVCDDGSWAIPLRRGRGRSLEGLKVLWLTKTKRGFAPQLEQGLGHMVALAGAAGSSMSLQKARVRGMTACSCSLLQACLFCPKH